MASGGPTLPGTGVPVELLLFAASLVRVALFRTRALPIALGGLGVVTRWRLARSPLATGPGLAGLATHLGAVGSAVRLGVLDSHPRANGGGHEGAPVASSARGH